MPEARNFTPRKRQSQPGSHQNFRVVNDGDLPVGRRPRRRAHGHRQLLLLLLLLLELLLLLMVAVVGRSRRRGELVNRQRWRRREAVAHVLLGCVSLNLHDGANIKNYIEAPFSTGLGGSSRTLVLFVS